MKHVSLVTIILLISHLSSAQDSTKMAPVKGPSLEDEFLIESRPQFPGGQAGFYRYLTKNLKYPEVAQLVGINGKVRMSFVVEKDGTVSNATAENCIGAGCETEAAKLLENSPKWVPGVQNGKVVRVLFFVPINYSIEEGKVKMKDLRKSGYGFVFNVKGMLYTIDEAEKLIGSSFMSQQVEIAEPFFNYNKIEKFNMPDKKDVYLIILKST